MAVWFGPDSKIEQAYWMSCYCLMMLESLYESQSGSAALKNGFHHVTFEIRVCIFPYVACRSQSRMGMRESKDMGLQEVQSKLILRFANFPSLKPEQVLTMYIETFSISKPFDAQPFNIWITRIGQTKLFVERCTALLWRSFLDSY